MIFTAESSFGDIDDKDCLDLGCGCAVLSIACVMLGARCVFTPLCHARERERKRQLTYLPNQTSSVLSVDADEAALSIARENIASLEMEEEIKLIHARIGVVGSLGNSTTKVEEEAIPVFVGLGLDRTFDTVVMNPPFGTWNQGIDMVFLEAACKVSPLTPRFLSHPLLTSLSPSQARRNSSLLPTQNEHKRFPQEKSSFVRV